MKTWTHFSSESTNHESWFRNKVPCSMGPRNGLSINLLSYCKVKHFMKTNSQLLIISLEVSRSPSLSLALSSLQRYSGLSLSYKCPIHGHGQKGECNVVHLVIRDETNRWIGTWPETMEHVFNRIVHWNFPPPPPVARSLSGDQPIRFYLPRSICPRLKSPFSGLY